MTQQENLSPGMVLGRYELLLPIAQGGMATVWAARQKGSRGFQKTVAIKTMLPSLSDDPQFEQMFLDEASLAARIHHPNVAEILDVGEQDETIYIVMEWVDGEALSVITKTAKRSNVPVPQRIALRIVRQACAGLHGAHELRNDDDQLLNLVHRDVSPQNILVSYDGIVKLVDFGVAKALGRAGGETTAGQLKGKVPYMSPEQALGQKVDRRTDIFAMGIVLYRLTTGLHPFLGENDLATMKNIISRPLLPPRMKNPSFPVELERVLLTCLKKDPNERYQTMLELDAALERVLALSGASVVDDDIGAFTRSVMGDRGQKRRAALRDAVRAADERAAGIGMSPGAAQPHVHEAVSDIAITRMNSALTSFPTSMPRNSSTSIIPPSPESYAGGAMSGSLVPSTPPQKNKRAGLFMAVGAVTALSLAGTFMFLRTTMEPRAAAGNAGGNVSPTPPSPPAPTQAAQTAAAPAPSASTGGGTVLDINDLPSADPNPEATTKRDDKPAGTTKGTGATKPPATTTATTKPTGAPTSTTWVPKVTDPGF
ncbi:serine/threonine-protein kinase [Polyangium jinanense]|uniref:Serine/threonine protein kinase n=1 Tax=Polyangium jinanense TaxID=2829994 RepID=A0A9X4AWG0_9BACT|nr:serine/threonine-protein kinase [Polyangium jinanense]MDC3958737.1 serine/threonine protein kinase [Polyangium jinanense]MDC3985282.1 serine/threonine protein kinase [Polyangium jinanense]